MKIQSLDEYYEDGCGRCKYFATENCKVKTWREELRALKSILEKTRLKPELKWSQPTYTYKGKNVLILSAFKDYAFLSFFKGALLKEGKNILVSPGKSSQSSKQLRFTSKVQVEEKEGLILTLIKEAIQIEEEGKKVKTQKIPEAMPEELKEFLRQDPALEKAFNSLSSGKKRSYLIHLGQAKQSSTRISRIQKCIPKIMKGEGFHDAYKKSKA